MNLPARLRPWLSLATKVGGELALDPALILAVMDRESRGGEALTPPGPAGVGDGGMGLGLMQLDRRYAGLPLLPDAWKDPETNIRAGATLLKANMLAFNMDVAAAVAAYNCNPAHIRQALKTMRPDATLAERIHAFDCFTTGRDYVSDVLARRDRFSTPANQDPDFSDVQGGCSTV